MAVKQTIQRILEQKRKDLGISRPKMAEKLGIERRTYYKKEAGDLKLDELIEICDKLGLKLLIVPDLYELTYTSNMHQK